MAAGSIKSYIIKDVRTRDWHGSGLYWEYMQEDRLQYNAGSHPGPIAKEHRLLRQKGPKFE